MIKIKQTINYLLKHKKTLNFIVILLCFSLSFFLFANYAYAGPIEDNIYLILNSIMSSFLAFLATGISALVAAVVWVAQINNFTKVPAVNYGWTIVRDLSNMFFILILLVIAFATILRVESYNAKRLLPRLLIMAVLINFSKTIAGLIIDAAQVVMLTFVASFADVNGFNFVNLMGLNEIIHFDKDSNKVATSAAIFSAYVLGIIYILIATVVMAVILAVLIYRVVMIWIYVVLSPLAYLMAAFPQGQGYAQRWWKEFLGHVTVGPVLAFFIWLSFISMGGVTQSGQADLTDLFPEGSSSRGQTQILENSPDALTKAGSVDHMIKFAIAIGMLIGGLMIAQQSGGLAGKAAGKGLDSLKRMGSGAGSLATKPLRSAGSAAKDFAVERGKDAKARAANLALAGTGKLLQKSKTDSLSKLGKVSSNLAGDIMKTRGKDREKKRQETLKKFGFRSDTKSLESLDEFSDTALARHAKTGLAATGAITLGALSGGTGGLGIMASGLVGAGLQMERTRLAEKGRKKTAAKKAEDEAIIKKSEKTRDENITNRQDTINTERNDKIKDFEAKNGKFSANPLPKDQYDQGLKDINNTYDDKLAAIKPDEEQQHQARLRSSDKGTRLGKLDQARDEALQKIKAEVEVEVKNIENNQSLNTKEREEKIKETRLSGEQKEKVVTDKYQADKKQLYSPFNNKLANALADYHPNKVTKNAIKKETGSTQTIIQQIKALQGGEDIDKFAASTFYSPSGFSPVHQKFFDKMTESNQEAKDAMLKTLNRLKNISIAQAQTGTITPPGVTKSNLTNIEALKKGLAALNKKGEDTSKFSEIIAELDKITTKQEEGAKTVQSYEASVIVPK